MKQIIYTPHLSAPTSSPIKIDFLLPQSFTPKQTAFPIETPGGSNKDYYKPEYNIATQSPPTTNSGLEPELPAEIVTTQDSFSIASFTDLLNKEGIKVRVTSGLRPGAKTKQGRQSYHSTGQALDIVPLDGNFNKLRQQISQNPTVLNYMKKHGIGILDETTPEVLARTGGTGAH